MILFSTGLSLTTIEQLSALYITSDLEKWLFDAIIEKGKVRQKALIHDWQPTLLADPSVTELPANVHELCALIMARNDYKTRLQQDAELTPPEEFDRHNLDRYEAVDRSGETVTLFPNGMDVTDVNTNCILAYNQDLESWVIGALLGLINRGKKKMLETWQPIILADPDVTTMPATEDGLINMIVARDDYKAMHR